MQFGLHVQQAGSTWLDAIARTLNDLVAKELADVQLNEVDGLYIGFYATARLPEGIRKTKRRVRRDYMMKVITGGSQHFRCLVELDAEVADADLVASAASEESLFEFVRSLVLRCLPLALKDLPQSDLQAIQAVVSAVHPPRRGRW